MKKFWQYLLGFLIGTQLVACICYNPSSKVFKESNVNLVKSSNGTEFCLIDNYDVGIESEKVSEDIVNHLKDYTFSNDNIYSACYGAFSQMYYRGLTSVNCCVMVVSVPVRYYLKTDATQIHDDIIYFVYFYEKHKDKYEYLGMANVTYIHEHYEDEIYGEDVYNYAKSLYNAYVNY